MRQWYCSDASLQSTYNKVSNVSQYV
jgi:hypothetical protein